jgi:hypothetical protein
MGPDMESRGTVSGWDPPRRFEITEPDWAGLVGRPDAVVTPMVSEFLVEARSGGTCVVRVVTSAFGTGADWENEFVADMEQNWKPMFDLLRVYLSHFAGETATPIHLSAELPGSIDDVRAALVGALGVAGPGDEVTARGIHAQVDLLDDQRVVLRMADPEPALLVFMVQSSGDDTTTVMFLGFVYGSGAPAYVDRETPAWQAWLDGLAVTA